MLHLNWSVAAGTSSTLPSHSQPVTSVSAIDTERADTDIARAIAKMTPTQRNAIEKALPIPPPTPSGSKLELRPAELRPPVRRGPPVVKHVQDVARDQKEQQINETARRILLLPR